jgi:hypothetical protein
MLLRLTPGRSPSHGIFERIAHPSADADGRRTPALRFGDPRVTALAGALAATLTAAVGITNKREITLLTLRSPQTLS